MGSYPTSPSSVHGQRADSAGPVSEIFTVNFGQAPGGTIEATVTSSAAGSGGGQVKFAA